MMRYALIALVATSLAGCTTGADAHPLLGHARSGATSPAEDPSRYLFVWAADRARHTGDLLVVLDADPRSATYATIVATLPIGATATVPHHTEYEMPEGGELLADGFFAGRVFRFDLRDPRAPRIAGEIANAVPYAFPHSFVRLANGHVLATYQYHLDDSVTSMVVAAHDHGGAPTPPATDARPPAPPGTTGGLAEFDATGHVLRISSARTTADSAVRPYSLAVLPAIDRVVTTSNDMFFSVRSRTVQVWRLSDLKLLSSITLPAGPRGDEQWNSAEPRALADGRTVLVNTNECGLYRLTALDTDRPSAQWVHTGLFDPNLRFGFCAVTAVTGHFLLEASGAERAIISFDVSDPAHPREVGRLSFGSNELPHWISLEPSGHRLVITGNGDLRGRILVARVDARTGALAIDSSFRSPGGTRPGVDLGVLPIPGKDTVLAVPHGAVFSRR